MICYVKHFDSNKTTSSKYTKMWERVSSLMKSKFDSEPVSGENDKYIKTKIKSYGDKIYTNF